MQPYRATPTYYDLVEGLKSKPKHEKYKRIGLIFESKASKLIRYQLVVVKEWSNAIHSNKSIVRGDPRARPNGLSGKGNIWVIDESLYAKSDFLANGTDSDHEENCESVFEEFAVKKVLSKHKNPIACPECGKLMKK
ncbi:hypothetical protein BpHYR1_028544 [Brachionus plicatilis]|uniref:Uncharacterized protein n=1 Tax=Brachionus plicatilis TaxID=10195 RepID=A0A3M7R408_BRAPC|nr:hypothetical protein BpHYR1_028544 [Brachionus plicatilis]